MGKHPLPAHVLGIWVFGHGCYVNMAQARMRNKMFTTWVRMFTTDKDKDHATEQSAPVEDNNPLSTLLKQNQPQEII